jgi:hypothetical protein
MLSRRFIFDVELDLCLAICRFRVACLWDIFLPADILLADA